MKGMVTAVAVWLLLMAGAASAAPRSQGQAGEFDFYVLSLSWSPTFCLTNPTDQQCTGKGYGFVLHGLWPQYARGGWPASCAPQSRLSHEEVAKGMSLFVTEKLLRHEWAKHGTCSGLEPSVYLDKTDAALGVVKVPESLQPLNAPTYLQAREIENLFRQSNPAMGNHGMAVICKGKQLSEVRVCLSKDLQFAGCPRSVKTQCREGEVRIPAQR
ncbi:MAG: Ribonuclease [Pseudomonas fluorescens]|nr:MAG: Ribonuclease [Pseudomonas fluorescens]